MKTERYLDEVVSSFYAKTYGTKIKDQQLSYKKRENFDKYNLIGISRKRESLAPIIRKALNYLYPAKQFLEINPMSDYDRQSRKLSIQNSETSPNRKIKLKKLSLSEVRDSKLLEIMSSNSQEYINCIGYNGQAESEYMMTKDGIREYQSLYKLMLKDSGLGLERIKPSKYLNKRKNKIF